MKVDDQQLTPEQLAHLNLWCSATAAQRLSWLHEMQQIAYKSGALKTFKPATTAIGDNKD